MSWTQCLKTPKETIAPVLQMIELNPGEVGELAQDHTLWAGWDSGPGVSCPKGWALI